MTEPTDTVLVYRSVDGHWRRVAPGQPVVHLYRSVTGWRVVEPQRRRAEPIPGQSFS